MESCAYCGESIDTLTYECTYCSQSLCRSHRLPETHDCTHISNARPPASTAGEAGADLNQSSEAGPAEEIDFRDPNVDLEELRKRAEAEAEGEPYSVAEVQHTVGTTPESNFSSSPDVAVDGSIKQSNTRSDDSAGDTPSAGGGYKRVVVAVISVLLVIALLYVAFAM